MGNTLIILMLATAFYYHYIGSIHFVTIGHCCFIPADTPLRIRPSASTRRWEPLTTTPWVLFQPVIMKEGFADRDYFNTERINPGWR